MKQKGLFVLIFLLINLFNYGQDQTAVVLIDKCNKIYNSNPDSSYYYAQLAEKAAIKSNDKEMQGIALLKQARYNILKSELEKAAERINQAVELLNAVDSKSGLAGAYSLSSFLSGRLGKIDEEIAYLEKSLELYKEIKDVKGITNVLTNLSLQYTYSNNLDIAKKHLIELTKTIIDKNSRSAYYLNQNWGHYYVRKGDYPLALEYYQKAKKIAEEQSMIDSKATINMVIGEVYQKMGDYANAKKYLEESLEISKQNDLVHEMLEAYQSLQKYYEETIDTEKAYQVFKNIVAIKDTLYNLEKVNRLNDYDKKLALAEKEKKLAEQKLLAKSEQSKNKILILVVILAVVLIAVAGYALYKTKRLKDQIAQQKEEAENQKSHLESAYTNITDSIEYAKKIQQAVLKAEDHLSKHLPEHFVLFEPKDIVSGDFYWAQEMDDDLYVAVADCTGHGVPGAFMSMLGIAFLNDIFSDFSGLSPAQTLNELRKRIIQELSQTGKEGESKDGMDISLAKINLKTFHMDWAGANNPLYIISSKEVVIESSNSKITNLQLDSNSKLLLSEVKPDKQPIGYYENMESFTNHSFQLNKGDLVYLFSDGYADQFGGMKGKKLKYKPFKELLIQNFAESMDMQKLLLKKYFINWKGDHEQVDDVCVMGLRI